MFKFRKLPIVIALAMSITCNAVTLESSGSPASSSVTSADLSYRTGITGVYLLRDSGTTVTNASMASVAAPVGAVSNVIGLGSSFTGSLTEGSATASSSSISNPIGSSNSSSSGIPSLVSDGSSIGSFGLGSSAEGSGLFTELSIDPVISSNSISALSTFPSFSADSGVTTSSVGLFDSVGSGSGSSGSADGSTTSAISNSIMGTSSSAPLNVVSGILGFLAGKNNGGVPPATPPVAPCEKGTPGCGGPSEPKGPVFVPVVKTNTVGFL